MRLLLKALRLLRGLPPGPLRLLRGWAPGQRGIKRGGQGEPHRRAATLRTAGSGRKGGGSGALELEALHRARVCRIARFFVAFFRWSEIEVGDYHACNWAKSVVVAVEDLLLLLVMSWTSDVLSEELHQRGEADKEHRAWR